MSTSVTFQIERHLAAARKHYVPKKLTFSPSVTSSPCHRRILYKFLRIEPDFFPTAKQVRIFNTGDALHDMMKNWVRKSVGLIDYRLPDGTQPINWFTKAPDLEFPVADESLQIKGKIDGVSIVDGEVWLFEFKSIKSEEFKKLKGPQEGHKKQGMPYAFLFEQDLKAGKYDYIEELKGRREVAGVIFMYLNKDNSELKEYRLAKDFSYFETVAQTIFTILEHVEAKTLPEPTEDYCHNCEFRLRCNKNLNPLAK